MKKEITPSGLIVRFNLEDVECKSAEQMEEETRKRIYQVLYEYWVSDDPVEIEMIKYPRYNKMEDPCSYSEVEIVFQYKDMELLPLSIREWLSEVLKKNVIHKESYPTIKIPHAGFALAIRYSKDHAVLKVPIDLDIEKAFKFFEENGVAVQYVGDVIGDSGGYIVIYPQKEGYGERIRKEISEEIPIIDVTG